MSGDSVATALGAIEAAGGLVTPRELAAEWGITEQAIAQRIRRGTFPEPVKVAGRVRLYLRDQVDSYREPAPTPRARPGAAARQKTTSPRVTGEKE